jgi:hypothetical protein
VGSTATITINGGGFDVGGAYTILWSKTPISSDSVECSQEVLTSCYTKVGEGRFPTDTKNITVSFAIPEAAYGPNFVQFQRFGRDKVYGFSFFVMPSLTATPATCTPRSAVTLKGAGFPAKNEDIKVSFDGKDTKLSIITNEVGSFTADFTIPDTMAGSHQFKATDENMSFGDVIIANLQVGPTISLQPEHPDIGAEVTLTGCGFASKSPVSIKYDDTVVSNSPTTDDTGNFAEKFTVPESSTANHVITATDRAGNVATYGLPLEGKPPSLPTPISPVDERFGWFGSQPVIFTWTDCTDPSGITYTLEVDNSLRFFPLEPGMRKTGLTKPNCVMNLGPGTYFWRVKAVDGAGNESEWSLSPYPFQVGFFSGLYLAVGAVIFFIIFIFIVRAFFRRVRQYYK